MLDAGRPVVTLNAEFHATIGSHFVGRGLLSEAEGDQPGCLAALGEDAVATGFTPLVYGNMKAFLNRNPSPEEMRYWAERQDYSIEMVTSFTDGTKVQIEQCLVANGLGAGIAKEDLIGLETAISRSRRPSSAPPPSGSATRSATTSWIAACSTACS